MTDRIAPELFFTPAANTSPYLKAAFQGFAGTGKTYTMALLAAELHRISGSTKPIVMIDTEKASRFLAPLFAARGIELVVRETRALSDLMTAIKIAEEGYADILMCDSLSHIWEGFVESYKQSRRKDRLSIDDWGKLKPTWKSGFSDRFVRSRVHVLFTGRAGYEYESEKIKDDSGREKLEMWRSGIKMKVEGETAYEPDVLVHMERFEELLADSKRVYRQATVLKDRSGLIDGQTIENPTGAHFAPVIEYLLAAPSAPVVQVEGDDAALFATDHDRKRTERAILLEEIQGAVAIAAPGQTAKEKAWRLAMMEKHFGTRSWTAIEQRTAIDQLRAGLDGVKQDAAALLAYTETRDASA